MLVQVYIEWVPAIVLFGAGFSLLLGLYGMIVGCLVIFWAWLMTEHPFKPPSEDEKAELAVQMPTLLIGLFMLLCTVASYLLGPVFLLAVFPSMYVFFVMVNCGY